MSLHRGLSPQAIENRIQRDQTPAAVLTPRQCELAFVFAHLTYRATVKHDQDAREQLRILSAITEEAQELYFAEVL